MNGTKATIDHDEIRQWAEARGAWPARVKKTGGRGDVGMIRLDFPGFSGKESLEQISWEDFFQKFDESNLALVYREEQARGGQSNFNKLVGRETVDVQGHSGRRTALPRRRAKQQGGAAAGGRSRAATKGRTTRRSASASAGEQAPQRGRKSATRGASKASGRAKKQEAPARSTRAASTRGAAKRKATKAAGGRKRAAAPRPRGRGTTGRTTRRRASA